MRSRRILWLLLLIGSIVLISLQGGTISYGIFFFLLSIPVVSFLYLIAVLIQFRIYQSLDSRVITAGVPMKYDFTLNNEGWLPISCLKVELYQDFSYVTDIPQQKEFELLPGESHTFETTMVCKYRGVYRVGVRKIILRDFLKLFTLKYSVQGALEAIVYPRIPEEDEYAAREEELKVLQRENTFKREQMDNVVREYLPGDSIRRIQWQATAKSGKLQSRKEIGEERNNVFLFLDTQRFAAEPKEYLPVENKKLELVLFLARESISKGQPVTFVYLQKDVIKGEINFKSVSADRYRDLDRIYDEVKEMEFTMIEKKAEKDAVWEKNQQFISSDASWIFVMEKLSDAMKDRLMEWKMRGMDLNLYMVGKYEEKGIENMDIPFSFVAVEDKE